MLKKIKQIKKALKFAKKQGITMQRRMMLYLLCLGFALLGLLVFVLLATGLLSNAEQHVEQGLQLHLRDVGKTMDENMELLAGHTTLLSQQLTNEIEVVMDRAEKKEIDDLNNDGEAILSLQKAVYPVLNTTLQVTQSSGAYAAVETTINTEAAGAESSRSGMYLRLTNISGNVSLAPTVVYFRGIPDIAREKGLELHNRWNLELDISRMPWYALQSASTKPRLADNCCLTKRIDLPNTWEKCIYITAPIRGRNGEFYGSCGVELSNLCFRILYPETESEYGHIFTVLAPVRDGRMFLSEGIIGERSGTVIRDDSVLSISKGKYFDSFESGMETYIGLSKEIRIKGMDGEAWSVAVMIPESGFLRYASKSRSVWMRIVFGFVLVMILASIILSNRFVKPIINRLERIYDGDHSSEENCGISEIDALVDFLKSQKNTKSLKEAVLPPNIEELFTKFENRVATLSNAEHTILNYYIDGHEISEIPDLAFISMSTVRTHNRNIYRKLEVASKDELMLYLDMLKRCGRIDRVRTKYEE